MISIDAVLSSIEELPEDDWVLWLNPFGKGTAHRFGTVEQLKVLAASYRRLRTAVEHYADKQNWGLMDDPYSQHPDKPCTDAYTYSHKGYEVAQAALTQGGHK